VAKLTERYDRGADPYREIWAPILRRAAQPLVRELAGPQVRRVLDVGTGVGALLPDLAAAFPGASVTGVDRSRGMLRCAPATAGRALMDARQLAIAQGREDRVFLLFILFHLDRPAEALREAHRVMRPGGRVGTLTWGTELDSRASQVWVECLERHGAIAPDPAVTARHAAVDAPAKMESLLRGAGFVDGRAWSDELACVIGAEHLIRLKTNLGSVKDRFDSLAPEAAAACVEEARHRMNALGPADFIARGQVIFATGRRS